MRSKKPGRAAQARRCVAMTAALLVANACNSSDSSSTEATTATALAEGSTSSSAATASTTSAASTTIAAADPADRVVASPQRRSRSWISRSSSMAAG